MQIRTRLTLQFLSFGAIILLLSFTAIYFFQAGYRKDDFYNRLQSKGTNTAKLLIEVDEVDVNLLKRIDRDNPMSLPKEVLIIYDNQDSVLYSTDDYNSLSIDDEIRGRIRENREVRYHRGEFDILGMIYQDDENELIVVVAAADIYGYRKMKNLLNILVFVSFFSLVVLLVAGWIFSGRAMKPISRVITRVDEISIASLNLRVDEGNGQDEIAKLAKTFNKMLDRLEKAFMVQKNFINNASHELRTPLTAISGQLEVLLLKKRSSEEYQHSISSILEDMKSLNQIANRLLLLAQASTEGRKAQFTMIRLDELLWQTQDDLMKRNPDYKIQVAIDNSIDEGRKLTIRGDEQLTKVMIINLMDNGCKFSPDHSMRVELNYRAEQIKLHFIDNGIGMSKEDLKHVFEPFRRGSNVHQIKGHGIGLSLVERVVRMQNGTITVESELNKGSAIKVTFPIA